MGQLKPYTKLSDLLERGSSNPSNTEWRGCNQAIELFRETLRSINAMNNDEREKLIKLLSYWMLTENFGFHARSAIHGLQRFSIADCLFEDPFWEPPTAVNAPRG
jgi:hypothetical protein